MADDAGVRDKDLKARKQEVKANIDRSFSDAIDTALPSVVSEAVADGLIPTASMLVRTNVPTLSPTMMLDLSRGRTSFSHRAWRVELLSDSSRCGEQPCAFAALRGILFVEDSRMSYVKWGRRTVNQLNSRTISQCTREFVSWSGMVRDE
jgi:hypothetical protein